MAMMHTTAIMIPTQITVILNQFSFENQKYMETGKRRTNVTILNLTTRLTVMMEAYRRFRVNARYRSKLMAVMAKKETKAREVLTGYVMAPDIQYKRKLYVNTPI